LQRAINSLLDAYPIPQEATWKTTINVAKIETDNTVFNKVPDTARAYLDIRFIPQEKDTIQERLKSLLPKDITMEIESYQPPQYTSEDNILIKQLKKQITDVTTKEVKMLATHGGSDMRFYEFRGIPAVCFGPTGFAHHGDDEWVDIQSLQDYYHILKNFLAAIKE